MLGSSLFKQSKPKGPLRHVESASERGKVAQSCLTLCDPMDYTVHGILLARIL